MGSESKRRPIILEEAAQGFAAAGSEPRLEVLIAIVRAKKDGLTVGEHHLRFLTAAGLIAQEKRGRKVINRARSAHIEALAAYLLKECVQ